MAVAPLYGSAPLDDADQDHRDGDEEQQMDEAAKGIRDEPAKRAQQQQANEDRTQPEVHSSGIEL
jgi:hypothetical protein